VLLFDFLTFRSRPRAAKKIIWKLKKVISFCYQVNKVTDQVTRASLLLNGWKCLDDCHQPWYVVKVSKNYLYTYIESMQRVRLIELLPPFFSRGTDFLYTFFSKMNLTFDWNPLLCLQLARTPTAQWSPIKKDAGAPLDSSVVKVSLKLVNLRGHQVQ
jgi:hypothetical protein